MIFRAATAADVPAIVALLTDEPLGKSRESADLAVCQAAFRDVAANPMHLLIVGEQDGEILATAQLTILAGLSRNGSKRALVESVRVAANYRSQGLGAQLLADCETRARAAEAKIIQLTTDKTRLRAHAF